MVVVGSWAREEDKLVVFNGTASMPIDIEQINKTKTWKWVDVLKCIDDEGQPQRAKNNTVVVSDITYLCE